MTEPSLIKFKDNIYPMSEQDVQAARKRAYSACTKCDQTGIVKVQLQAPSELELPVLYKRSECACQSRISTMINLSFYGFNIETLEKYDLMGFVNNQENFSAETRDLIVSYINSISLVRKSASNIIVCARLNAGNTQGIGKSTLATLLAGLHFEDANKAGEVRYIQRYVDLREFIERGWRHGETGYNIEGRHGSIVSLLDVDLLVIDNISFDVFSVIQSRGPNDNPVEAAKSWLKYMVERRSKNKKPTIMVLGMPFMAFNEKFPDHLRADTYTPIEISNEFNLRSLMAHRPVWQRDPHV